MSKDYAEATSENLRLALVTIIFMQDNLFTRGENNKIDLKYKEIETLIGHKLAYFGFPTVSGQKKYPVINCKITGDLEGNKLNNAKFKKFLLERNRFQGKLTIKLTSPAKFSIRPVLLTLIEEGILFDTVDTKKGRLCIYINDGNKLIENPKTN